MKSSTLLALVAVGLLVASPVRADDAVPPAILSAIYSDHAPTFGSPSGVTIVEFYDYQCSYCKAAEEGLERLMREDRGVTLILMDFPKLGPLSITAAKATLAAMRQDMNKYWIYHASLMNKNIVLTEDRLYEAARGAGLDIDRLKQDMQDPAIQQQIQARMDVGRQAGVKVTPSFIIGGQRVFGYQQYDQLKQMVAYIRQSRH